MLIIMLTCSLRFGGKLSVGGKVYHVYLKNEKGGSLGMWPLAGCMGKLKKKCLR